MWKRMSDAMSADPDLSVFCSNLGDLSSVVNRPDGTDAERGMIRVTGQGVTRQWLERVGGQLNVQTRRIAGRSASALTRTNRAQRTQSSLCGSWRHTRWLNSA
ncbi:putative fatty acyl-AMP ligase and polyketide synthase [Mycobacterium xenopi 3993]|nr:putative fatty acyl-AMP ligase and polyketide synthase [Mycobacterium xenopi 3993]